MELVSQDKLIRSKIDVIVTRYGTGDQVWLVLKTGTPQLENISYITLNPSELYKLTMTLLSIHYDKEAMKDGVNPCTSK